MKQSIMWLKDTGILERVKYDVFNPAIPIPDPRVRYNQPLILRQLGIVMIILVVGLFIATIVFLVELLKKPKLNNAPKAEDGIEMTTLELIARTDMQERAKARLRESHLLAPSGRGGRVHAT